MALLYIWNCYCNIVVIIWRKKIIHYRNMYDSQESFTDLRTVLEKLNITNRLMYGVMLHKRGKVVWWIGNIISRIQNIVWWIMNGVWWMGTSMWRKGTGKASLKNELIDWFKIRIFLVSSITVSVSYFLTNYIKHLYCTATYKSQDKQIKCVVYIRYMTCNPI